MMKTPHLTPLLIMLMMTLMFLIILNNFHPIFLIILLMLYTLMICLMMSMWSLNYIYSIMLFLIMISGLLIIFLYFSSLVSNEQNKIFWNFPLLLNLMLNFIILIVLYFYKNYYASFPSTYLPAHMNNMNLTHPFTNIMKIFFYPNNNMTLISMFYLLIALFTIIKICSLKSTSLRKIN